MCAQRRFEFDLAGENDDEGLRTLLRTISMPGEITLSFQREPSFFLAEQAGNITSQVAVCKDQQTGQVVGMGSRSIRSVYIAGQPTRIGYLSMLRGSTETRGSLAFARSYHYLRTLHSDGVVPYYFTTILDENTSARTLLTSGRAGLPVYKPVARLFTYLIPLRRNVAGQRYSDAVKKLDEQHLSEGVAFLQNWNSNYQFAPVYTLEDICGQSPLLPGFCWDNFFACYRHGRICGTLAVWDQQSFKQTIVTAYSRRMSYVRPFYNLFATVAGRPGLPAIGAEVKLVYAMGVSGDTAAFAALLQRAYAEWSGRGYDYLSVGLCENSPLTAVASQYATQRIVSTVYVVYWSQDTHIQVPGTDRPVHLEVATL